MDSGYVTRVEYQEHNARMEDEHKRQNHRLELLEEATKQNNKLLISVEKLALSMENMQKELKEQGERVDTLEARDGESWRNLVKEVIKILLGVVLGVVLTQIGL